jgi:hypothetical protein
MLRVDQIPVISPADSSLLLVYIFKKDLPHTFMIDRGIGASPLLGDKRFLRRALVLADTKRYYMGQLSLCNGNGSLFCGMEVHETR